MNDAVIVAFFAGMLVAGVISYFLIRRCVAANHALYDEYVYLVAMSEIDEREYLTLRTSVGAEAVKRMLINRWKASHPNWM